MKATNSLGLLFVILTVIFTVTGQLLMKKGMAIQGATPGGVVPAALHMLRALGNPYVLGSFISAGLAAFSWMAAISRTELSVAYPFMGLAIVLTIALTPVLFGERVSPQQWLGVALVVAGVWISSRST